MKKIGYFLYISSILIIIKYIFANESLVEALKKKDYKPKGDIIITKPCDINDTLCEVDIFSSNSSSNDLDLILLKNHLNMPMHSINIGVLKVKKTQKKIEKEISKDIKSLFFIPKEIKVKSKIKGDKIYTQFIYNFKD